MRYEYRVIPAPSRGQKAKGLKTAEARFAFAVETVMNDLAAEGWEYLRADTLPSDERQGLTASGPAFRTLLVFRRAQEGDLAAFRPKLLETAPEEATRPVTPPEPVLTRAKPEAAAPEPAAAETLTLPEAEVPENPATPPRAE